MATKHITKIISISDECRGGCQAARYQAALERVLKLAESLQREPVQSRSVERRYSMLIQAAAKEGLLS